VSQIGNSTKEVLALLVECQQVVAVVVSDLAVDFGRAAKSFDSQWPAHECFKFIIVLLLDLAYLGAEGNITGIEHQLQHHRYLNSLEHREPPGIFNDLSKLVVPVASPFLGFATLTHQLDSPFDTFELLAVKPKVCRHKRVREHGQHGFFN
jgi:hypothetical protein